MTRDIHIQTHRFSNGRNLIAWLLLIAGTIAIMAILVTKVTHVFPFDKYVTKYGFFKVTTDHDTFNKQKSTTLSYDPQKGVCCSLSLLKDSTKQYLAFQFQTHPKGVEDDHNKIQLGFSFIKDAGIVGSNLTIKDKELKLTETFDYDFKQNLATKTLSYQELDDLLSYLGDSDFLEVIVNDGSQSYNLPICVHNLPTCIHEDTIQSVEDNFAELAIVDFRNRIATMSTSVVTKDDRISIKSIHRHQNILTISQSGRKNQSAGTYLYFQAINERERGREKYYMGFGRQNGLNFIAFHFLNNSGLKQIKSDNIRGIYRFYNERGERTVNIKDSFKYDRENGIVSAMLGDMEMLEIFSSLVQSQRIGLKLEGLDGEFDYYYYYETEQSNNNLADVVDDYVERVGLIHVDRVIDVEDDATIVVNKTEYTLDLVVFDRLDTSNQDRTTYLFYRNGTPIEDLGAITIAFGASTNSNYKIMFHFRSGFNRELTWMFEDDFDSNNIIELAYTFIERQGEKTIPVRGIYNYNIETAVASKVISSDEFTSVLEGMRSSTALRLDAFLSFDEPATRRSRFYLGTTVRNEDGVVKTIKEFLNRIDQVNGEKF